MNLNVNNKPFNQKKKNILDIPHLLKYGNEKSSKIIVENPLKKVNFGNVWSENVQFLCMQKPV